MADLNVGEVASEKSGQIVDQQLADAFVKENPDECFRLHAASGTKAVMKLQAASTSSSVTS